MTSWNTKDLITTDKQFVWHPFTNMPEWCAPEHEPIVIVEGHGAILRDSRGREYIDGNSSIWTNIHGHNRRFWGQRTRPQSNWRGKLLNIFPRKLCRVCFIPTTARLESKRRCALPHNFFTCGARNELCLSRFAAVTTAILRVRRRWGRRRCFRSIRKVGDFRFAPLVQSRNWKNFLADSQTKSRRW